METVHLATQHLIGDCGDPPPLDEWEGRLKRLSDAEVEKHRQLALACLSKDVGSQAWSPHVGIAEAILRERKEAREKAGL
jgi:hypothetical protein